MPKNAANKLINEEVRLPVTTTNSTTETTTTRTTKDSSVHSNTTKTAEGLLQQEHFENSIATTTTTITETETPNEKTSIKNSSPVHITITTTTTKSLNHSQVQQQQQNEHNEEDLNTFPSGGHHDKNFDKLASSSSPSEIRTTTSLYPVVIETTDKDTAAAVATTTTTAAATTQTVFKETNVAYVAGEEAAILINGSSNTTTNNSSSNSSSGGKVARKRKVKSWNLKITATVSNRRATLRARKIVVDNSGTNNSNTNVTTQTNNKNNNIKNKNNITADSKEKSAAATPAAAEKVQLELVESDNKNATKKTTTCISGNTSVLCYLDAAVLNRIDILECEVKKGGIKRKRLNRAALPSNKVIGSRKRVRSASAAETQQQEDQEQQQQEKHSKSNFDFNFLPPSGGEQKENNATTNSTGAAFGKKRAARNTHSNKNIDNMSLYERRYARDDAGRSGSGGVVSNGFLTSATTRNSSAASSAAAASDSAADDIQSSSASQQYYMSAASESSSTLTPGISNSLSASNGSGIAAPSMATLCNIGNTCYLNSVVYTLRFAPQFLHNLHHLIVDLGNIQQNIVRQQRAKSSSLGRSGMSAMHMENARSWSSKDLASLEQYGVGPALTGSAAISGSGNASSAAARITQKSSHQLLTERLHELYQSLHRNEATDSSEPFHADTLLHAIQDVSAIFEGNQQQDAHEFLMCVLNSIRETCQTLIKAISECPDVILNGYISNPDDVDAAALDKDAALTAANIPSSSGGGGGNGSSSSLSTSNITKAYFFSRKSKRKEEGKNSKNTRLQSPLKDSLSSGGGGTGVGMQQQQQPTSNSYFYLNTVDLSGSTSAQTAASSVAAAATAAASTKATTAKIGAAGGDDEAAAACSPAVVSLLKDKERLSAKIRELGLDFFTEDFEGITVSTTKCLSCETITEQKESMIDIAVPVPISGYDSADYTEKPCSFIQNSCITREYFRGDNKYRCEKCTGYTEAIRSISYEVLPRLLVIQLSRFSGGMEKINSYIPTSFTLQCFCAKCCELSDANKLHIYKLYSVITHVGATMSVGHYIAYTSSLDYWANEYSNCPKDRRASQPTSQQQTPNGQLLQNNGNTASSAASVAASALASSGTSLIKKMKFGRSKASSSGDMSKNVKNLNGIGSSGGGGITSKTITNGIGKLSMSSASSTSSTPNTTCHSLSCCATRLCSAHQQQLNSDLSEEALQNGSNHANSSAASSSYNNHYYPSGYGSSGRGGASSKNSYSSCANMNATASGATSTSSSAEPIWYMCDDDKIKAMTQREFEELLSPSRKITITPYLLFYCKFDLQPTATPPKSVQLPSQNLAGAVATAAWQAPNELSAGSLLKM